MDFQNTTKSINLKPITRAEKETVSDEEVINQWDMRAQRPGLQAVMSIRYTLRENEESTARFLQEIFEFLKGHLERKKVFELGVGVGRITSGLARKAEEVVGCDLSPIMLGRAKENLKEVNNIKLYVGKITELDIPEKSFDLVFTSEVLQHILNPEELKETAEKMRQLSDKICIVEHVDQGPEFTMSKFTILRTPEEYKTLFAPYECAQQKIFFEGNDKLSMMLFENTLNPN